MVRWLAILGAAALAIGVAYGQSSQPSQPALPLGQAPMMGPSMMQGGGMGMGMGQMPMMQMMSPDMMMGQGMMQQGMMNPAMMGPGMMGPGMMGPGMMGPGMVGSGMAGGDMTGPMMCRGQMGMMGMADSAPSYLEARLAFVKSELAIGAAQQAAWDKYAAALRAQVKPMAARMAAMRQAMADAADFPARFDARVSMLEGQLSSLKSVRDAAVALYGDLSAEQKRKADSLLPMSLCM